MQRVIHTDGYTLIHPFLDMLERFYVGVSNDDDQSSGLFTIKPVYDNSFKDLWDIFKVQSGMELDCLFGDIQCTELQLPKYDPKNIIVCFSGGKDSMATARHYQKLGYNVTLYHVKGLNKTYCGKFSEHYVAEDCAEYMGLPIVIENVGYSGYHKWIEHPMKNMILMGMALTYGIRNNITDKIAVGTFKTAYLIDNEFGVCGGDCVEMWSAYENIVHRFLPNFKVHIPNLNCQTAFNVIKKDPEILSHVNSCVTQNKYRQQFRDRTQNKYKIELLPNRCGCCWKCALEYIWCTDHNILELNEDYYIHCIDVLIYTLYKETGVSPWNVDSTWSTYIFYPMNKSKLREKLKDAIIYRGKIKVTD